MDSRLYTADVGRTTFYAHFETKDALLEEVCHEIFDHFFERHLQSEATHDFSHDDSLEARVAHVLFHLDDSLDVLGGLLDEGNGGTFARIFKGYLAELFAVMPPTPGVPADYALNHLECDFMEALRWWTRNRSYGPEEICAFFCATSMPESRGHVTHVGTPA